MPDQKKLLAWSQCSTDYPNKSVRAPGQTIVDLFQVQVESRPDHVAVVFEDEEISYRALNTKANRLAHYLMTMGVGAERLTGLCVQCSIEMVTGLLGILKSGSKEESIEWQLGSYRNELLQEIKKNMKKRITVDNFSTV